MKSKKKIILYVLIAVIVVGGAIWLFGGKKAQSKLVYETAVVKKGEISESVTATGSIEPVTEGKRHHRRNLCRLQLGGEERATYRHDGPRDPGK